MFVTPATCTSASIPFQSQVLAGLSASTFTKEGPGWYVLPGATRIFEVPLTATECKSTTSVAVEVFGHNRSLKGASQVSPAACVLPPSSDRCGGAARRHAGSRTGALDSGLVNDEPKGDIEIWLTADGPWVDPSVLVAAGVLTVPDGRRQPFAPEATPRVLLASLAPQITFTLDEAEIA